MEDRKFARKDFDGKIGRLEITIKPNFSFEWETAPHQDKEIVVGKVIVAKLNYEQKNTQVIRGEYNSGEQLKEKGVELANVLGYSVGAYVPYESIEKFARLVPERQKFAELKSPKKY